MKRFLWETWELWYWAMFCPSRLQQRMNEWAPAEEKDGLRSDTPSWNLLLLPKSNRFIAQFLLLIFLFSLPLIWRIALHGQVLDLLLLFGAIATAYSIGTFCLSIGFHIPLLVYFIYPLNTNIYLIGLDRVRDILPQFPQVAMGVFFGILALIISMGFARWLANRERVFFAGNIFVIGGTLSIWLGIWLATQNWYFALSVSGQMGLFLLVLLTWDDWTVGLVMMPLVVLVVVTIMAAFMGGIVGSMMGGIVGSTVVLIIGVVVLSIMMNSIQNIEEFIFM